MCTFFFFCRFHSNVCPPRQTTLRGGPGPKYEPRRPRGWKLTIIEQRNRIQDLLSDSPSLKPYLESIFANCYEEAREDILCKSNYYWDLLPLIPEQSPFLLNEVLESAFSEY